MKISMLSDKRFLKGINKLFSYSSTLSISGESGTGKTTLALFLVGNCLNHEEQCIWIQASEIFPIKRLNQIFEATPDKLQYIKENIFILPQSHVIHTYQEQCGIFQILLSDETVLPPNLKFIVIDNISHHLRYEISQLSNISLVLKTMDEFYEYYLMPLIILCKRNSITLLLIHEVTFDPGTSQMRPFFYKLYDRLNTIKIVLNNRINSFKKNIHISIDNLEWNFRYTLEPSGIAIY